MKKIIAFVFLIFAVNAAAQNIPITDTVIRFGVTQKGRPDGLKSEVKIGKEGGTIQSSDGKVELIFPEGAVIKKTTISIQPVTNSAPNSNGKAYQMEPSGINFQQPVQIIFHYRDKDCESIREWRLNALYLNVAETSSMSRMVAAANCPIKEVTEGS